jgi:hypothetical protein
VLLAVGGGAWCGCVGSGLRWRERRRVAICEVGVVRGGLLGWQ